MVTDNAVVIKSKLFAVRIVKMSQYLKTNHGYNPMFSQVLRSGTSIGANINEAVQGQSRADFVAKLSIALKEASETQYWLELLFSSSYLSECEFDSINENCTELIKLLTSIIRTTRDNGV